MSGGHTRTDYLARVDRVRQMAGDGHPRAEIAAAVGLSLPGLNGLCRRNRIYTRRARKIPAPHAPRLVQQLMEKIRQQRATVEMVEERAGLGNNTVNRWRHESVPRLDNFEAAANALGYELVLREMRG